MRINGHHASLAAGICIAALATPAYAQQRQFNIPAGSLKSALDAYGRQAGRPIIYKADEVRGARSKGYRGTATVDAALDAILMNSGFSARAGTAGAIAIVRNQMRTSMTDEAALTTDDGTGEEVYDDIVVTAARREQKLIDVPMSITAVSQAELERRGAVSLLDLSRGVPGLVVIESGPGQNQIFLRGVANPNGIASLVGVYMDEIPVTGASLGQLDLQLVDLERVEVLRGPQGTLYGQGSAGGTVRFITRNPDLNSVSGEASLSAYATRHGDFSERFSGFVNVPVIDDVLGFRVSGTLANIGGWIDQPAAGRKDINDQLIRNIRVKGLWRPADGLDIAGTVVVHRNKGDGLTVGADKHYDVDFPNGDPLAQEALVDNYEIYNLTATYDFGGVQLMSSTSHVDAHKYNAGVALKLPGLETFNRDTLDSKSFTQEVRLSSTGKRRLNWVVGAFYTDETIDRLQVLDLYSEGEFLGVDSVDSSDKSETISVFGDISFSVTDRFQLGTGLRYFHDSRKRARNGAPDQAGTFESVNPRFYASYDLARNATLYANIAKGFRSGGFQGNGVNTTFDPENVWSYEAGTKGGSGGFRWDVTGFYSKYKGYQAFVLGQGVFGGLMNAGNAEIYGVDWSFAVDPVKNLTLQLSGNVTSTELVFVLPASTSNITGDRLDYIPDYSIAASAEYRFDWSAERPGFVRVDYNQIGPGTVTDRSLDIVAFRTNTLNMLNARIGLEHGRWGVELFGENLLGENGRQDPLEALGFGTRPRPRVIGAKVKASF
ncbi:MAG: TonB-dependent receptor domain-containing protein [Sphingobium sp.]